MCGLVGIAGEVGYKEEKMFADLLMLDTVRGKHSTGVASISSFGNGYNLHVTKKAVSGPDFVESAGFKAITSRVNRILMGHNRFATKGAINDENAHPFEFSKLVGAHNGSLTYYTNMFEHEKYSVDSQALYSDINENGVDTTWGKMNGAAALTWIDTENLHINFLRNKERPLFYCYGNKGRTLIWASEPWMIMVAAMRQGVEVEEKCHEVTINTLYTFEVPLTADKKEKVALKRREVKPYVRPVYSGGWNGYSENDYRSKGKEFLEKEQATYGDTLYFTVDTIKDYTSSAGFEQADIIGKTLSGTPIRITHMDSDKNDALLLEMWETDDAVFRGRVSYADERGIALSAYAVESCGYTVADLAGDDTLDEGVEALGQGNHEPKKEESVKEETEKPAGDKPNISRISYKISCSYCRKMVSEYYCDKAKGVSVCCTDCWDNSMVHLTVQQRTQVGQGAFQSKH